MADRNAPRELAERFVQSRRYELEEPHLPSYEELRFSNDVGARSSSVGLHGNDGRLNEDSHGDEFLGYPDSNMNHRRPKRAKSRGNSVSRRESLQKRRLKEPRKSHKSTHGVSQADDSNGQASSHRSRSRGLSYSSNSITHKADDSTAGPSQRRARPKQILRLLKNPGPRELVNNLMQAHPHLISAPTVSPRSLTTPVIIPQRRPGDTNRGFMRAYSPVLQDYGIGQDDFMDFLCTLDEANKASSVLQVINIATQLTVFIPEQSVQIASLVMGIAVPLAMKLQSTHRCGSFLEKMNEQFFMPRGLFCLVMAYIPDSNHSHEPNSVTDLISRKLETVGSIRNNLNRHDGKTYGELEMPPAAPLVFLETKPSLNLDSTIIKQTSMCLESNWMPKNRVNIWQITRAR